MGNSAVATAALLPISKPTTLDAALTVIEGMRGAINTLTAQIENGNIKRCTECGEPLDVLSFQENDVRRLVYARSLIKAGRVDDGLHELDRVIAENDDNCKAQVGARVVML